MGHRLHPDQVDAIRRRAAEGEKQIALAMEFGVTQQSISAIVRGKRHRRLLDDDAPRRARTRSQDI